MIVRPNLEFEIIHDNNKDLCFIGNSFTNETLYRYFKQYRSAEIIRYEDALGKNQEWFNNHQFIVTAASVQFKKMVVNGLSNFSPHYFSVLAQSNRIGFNVSIGHGSVIDDFNTILDGATIGDHSLISHHCAISHGVTIGNFCLIGPLTSLLFTNLGSGCYVGVRSSFIGYADKPTIVTDYCNFIVGSTVTKSIDKAGTYFNNRCIDNQTSLDRKID